MFCGITDDVFQDYIECMVPEVTIRTLYINAARWGSRILKIHLYVRYMNSGNVLLQDEFLIEFLDDTLKLRVVCSKGTYIRALARDIGAHLGCGAHWKELVRTKIGEYSLNNSFSIEGFIDKIKNDNALNWSLSRHREFCVSSKQCNNRWRFWWSSQRPPVFAGATLFFFRRIGRRAVRCDLLASPPRIV